MGGDVSKCKEDDFENLFTSGDHSSSSEGGYSVDLVDSSVREMKELECPICFLLMRDAQVLDCHHAMCLTCLQKWERETIARNNPYTCPQCCRVIDRDKIVPGGVIDRLITTSIRIKCRSSTSGCNWTGVISNLLDHLRIDCGYTVIKCDNQRCNEVLLRRSLEAHKEECVYSSTDCKHCNLEVARIDLEDHLKVCEFFPVHCENAGCSVSIPRKEIEYHSLNECLFKIVKCMYAPMGCKFEGAQKDMDTHSDASMKVHMELMFHKLLQQQPAKIVWVNTEEFAEKSLYFKSMHQAFLKAKQLCKECVETIEKVTVEFDKSLDIFNARVNLDTNLKSIVEKFSNDLVCIVEEYRNFDVATLANIREDLVGKQTLLTKDDQEYLDKKISVVYHQRMKEFDKLAIDAPAWSYSSRFLSALKMMKLHKPYYVGNRVCVKTDVTGLGDKDHDDKWYLRMRVGNWDTTIDKTTCHFLQELDQLYHSVSLVSPLRKEVFSLGFIRQTSTAKYFELPPLGDFLNFWSADGVVVFEFTNSR